MRDSIKECMINENILKKEKKYRWLVMTKYSFVAFNSYLDLTWRKPEEKSNFIRVQVIGFPSPPKMSAFKQLLFIEHLICVKQCQIKS